MDQLSATRTVLGKVWIAESDEADAYWLEGEPAEIQVERTDEDEIRIGSMLSGQTHESASIYLSRSEAIRLVLAVAAAVGDR